MRARLLPTRAFVIETPLAPAEARKRIADAVEAPQWKRGRLARPSMKRPFVGTVDGDAFDMEQASYQRNAFRPVIEGRVEAAEGDGEGARVSGRMHMRYPGMVFLAVWFGGLLVGALVLARRALAAGRFDPLVFGPLGMIILGAALTAVGFIPETRRALAALAKVVKGSRAALD
jgi:hypothetical protein